MYKIQKHVKFIAGNRCEWYAIHRISDKQIVFASESLNSIELAFRGMAN